MRVLSCVLVAICAWVGSYVTASAEFLISSAIIEFTKDGPSNQDIDLISRSKDSDYIVAEVSEIIHPGQADEHRQIIEDPSQGILLVTPDKTILAAGNRKVLRFVLLKEPDEQEHIYRVALRPVIRGIDNKNTKVGLKILVGYEVLVIVRPAAMTSDYTVQRNGNMLHIVNHSNTNILFQNGQQCIADNDCKVLPVVRVYPGQEQKIPLPGNGIANYSIWNGQETTEKQY